MSRLQKNFFQDERATHPKFKKYLIEQMARLIYFVMKYKIKFKFRKDFLTMGFFDGMKALFDTKRWYTPENLYEYFRYEIYGTTNQDTFKYQVTTNIRKNLDEFTMEYFPEAQPSKSEINHVVTREHMKLVDDEFWCMPYIGRINVYNCYGDYLGDLYYRIVVYANKYAELSKIKGQETKTTVSKKPLKI